MLSMRARAKPSVRISSISFLYSPLRPRMIGAKTWMRVPSGSSKVRSTICSTVCLVSGLPVMGSCGTPTRANSRRR